MRPRPFSSLAQGELAQGYANQTDREAQRAIPTDPDDDPPTGWFDRRWAGEDPWAVGPSGPTKEE